MFEFIRFLRKSGKLWLAPLVFIMFIIGALLIAAKGSILAPLIYTLF